MGISSALGYNALTPSGVGYRNLLYNGAMQVHQRGVSTTGITSSSYYTADRWKTTNIGAGTWTQTVENDAPTGSGFGKSLKMLCTTADASLGASDELDIRQTLEGQDCQAIRKGTSSAQSLTLSFWVKSNVVGTYVCWLYDADNTRIVGANYSVSSSGAWEEKTIKFPADTTGAFTNDNNASLIVSFQLAAGSNFTSGTLPSSWASYSAANQAVGQVNLASATNNYWQITGVQMIVGEVERPFEFRSYGQELAECQRYYMKWLSTSLAGRIALGSAVTTSACNFHLPYKVQPRTVLGTLSVGSSLGMSDGVSAPFVIFVLSRLDVICSDTFYGVQGTSSGMTQFRPMYLEATSSSPSGTGFVASDMEL